MICSSTLKEERKKRVKDDMDMKGVSMKMTVDGGGWKNNTCCA